MSFLSSAISAAARPYLSAIGRVGGKAGKGSPAKKASAKKANEARWKNHKKKAIPAGAGFGKKTGHALLSNGHKTKEKHIKTSAAFPSKYLKADDLQGKDVVVKIAKVTMEDFDGDKGNESKLIIAFAGKAKTLVCNKTNAKTIAKVLNSDETDDWIGKCVIIGPREVEFQGDQVWTIRVSLKAPAAAPAKEKPAPEPDNDGFAPAEDGPGF